MIKYGSFKDYIAQTDEVQFIKFNKNFDTDIMITQTTEY